MNDIKSEFIGLRVDADIVSMLDKCAKDMGMSRSDVARTAIAMYYESIYGKETPKKEETDLEKEKLDSSMMLRVSSKEKEKIRQFCQDNNTTLLKLIRLGMEFFYKQE